MEQPFGFRSNQPTVWYSRDPKLGNVCCLYCGVQFDRGIPSDKEHLIGRNFVPTGSLDGDAFNFIFRTCRECNADKAEAERHVSAVTLFTSPARAEDQAVDEVATRKGSRDYHPAVSGTVVEDAFVEEEVEMPATFGSVKLGLVGPPQLEYPLVYLLAARQVQALFSLVTTRNPRELADMRILPPANVALFRYYNHSDWGNPQLLELVRRTQSWICLAKCITARGFFKAELRRSPVDDDGWFWVLEWNKSLRVAGAICNPSDPPGWLVEDLPPLEWSPPGPFRFRREVRLPEGSDNLFVFPDS